MDYKELKMDFLPDVDPQLAEELLVAELAGLGFESFYTENGCLSAFIPDAEQPGMQQLKELTEAWASDLRWIHHAQQNWNQTDRKSVV